jgi:hypothetical protein
MMGTKLATGPRPATPSGPDSQPHWKIATVAPKAAPTDSTNPAVALMGMATDRNATIRSRRESPITTTAKGTSASLSLVERSMLTAVSPVTAT